MSGAEFPQLSQHGRSIDSCHPRRLSAFILLSGQTLATPQGPLFFCLWFLCLNWKIPEAPPRARSVPPSKVAAHSIKWSITFPDWTPTRRRRRRKRRPWTTTLRLRLRPTTNRRLKSHQEGRPGASNASRDAALCRCNMQQMARPALLSLTAFYVGAPVPPIRWPSPPWPLLSVNFSPRQTRYDSSPVTFVGTFYAGSSEWRHRSRVITCTKFPVRHLWKHGLRMISAGLFHRGLIPVMHLWPPKLLFFPRLIPLFIFVSSVIFSCWNMIWCWPCFFVFFGIFWASRWDDVTRNRPVRTSREPPANDRKRKDEGERLNAIRRKEGGTKKSTMNQSQGHVKVSYRVWAAQHRDDHRRRSMPVSPVSWAHLATQRLKFRRRYGAHDLHIGQLVADWSSPAPPSSCWSRRS